MGKFLVFCGFIILFYIEHLLLGIMARNFKEKLVKKILDFYFIAYSKDAKISNSIAQLKPEWLSHVVFRRFY